MAIKKYFSDADNTITNAFKMDLQTRGTGANMGLSDILETFSIYGQASSGSTELERILIKFPVSQISSDRSSGIIPDSGKVSFYLNMYNAPHNQTTPREGELVILPISQSWQEGTGLDMDEYKDVVKQNEGSNWINAGKSVPWTREGGDYLSSPVYSQVFPIGNENLKMDITALVENWIDGTIDNYGIGIHFTSSQEAFFSNSVGADVGSQLFNPGGSTDTWYTKKFFGRGSEYFFKRPTIEAKWNNTIKDDRGNFYASSSLVTAEENIQTLYLYNVIRGRLKNIPGIGTGQLKVCIYDSISGGSTIGPTITGGHSSTGIYTASFSLDTTSSVAYDRWFDFGMTEVYHTGTFAITQYAASTYSPYPKLVTALTNLKSVYNQNETTRFEFYVRDKDWSPTIYTVATTETDTMTIESASYQITRIIDDLIVVPHDTGSDNATALSYDMSGNYFDFDMGLLESGYSYKISVAYYDESVDSYIEQPYEWKFRVENA